MNAAPIVAIAAMIAPAIGTFQARSRFATPAVYRRGVVRRTPSRRQGGRRRARIRPSSAERRYVALNRRNAERAWVPLSHAPSSSSFLPHHTKSKRQLCRRALWQRHPLR
jgi:hypothetical protein